MRDGSGGAAGSFHITPGKWCAARRNSVPSACTPWLSSSSSRCRRDSVRSEGLRSRSGGVSATIGLPPCGDVHGIPPMIHCIFTTEGGPMTQVMLPSHWHTVRCTVVRDPGAACRRALQGSGHGRRQACSERCDWGGSIACGALPTATTCHRRRQVPARRRHGPACGRPDDPADAGRWGACVHRRCVIVRIVWPGAASGRLPAR